MKLGLSGCVLCRSGVFFSKRTWVLSTVFERCVKYADAADAECVGVAHTDDWMGCVMSFAVLGMLVAGYARGSKQSDSFA